MNKKFKKPGTVNIIIGFVFLILFIMTLIFHVGKWDGYKALVIQFISIALLFIALINFIPKREYENKYFKTQKKKYKTSNIVAIIFAIITVPLTILAGHYIFNNEKHNLISLLIIAELLLPFILSFELKGPVVRELVIISVMCAIAITGRIIFSPIPQFKPIVAIIIISGVCLGSEKGFMIGAISALVSNMVFGQGSWTPFQMLALGATGFFAGIIFNRVIIIKSKIAITIFGAVSTIVIYGGIANFQSLLFYPAITLETVITTYTMGLPFDLIHAVSTAFFLWFISEPIIEKIERIKIKYNILQ